ncbi:hypothetical protein F5X96DRAFT_692210 [Biscogniauxia mediterranea]|nr:hypothetical protein F5X96DRAFT_692210 [Biscogniauxia mediterranea]
MVQKYSRLGPRFTSDSEIVSIMEATQTTKTSYTPQDRSYGPSSSLALPNCLDQTIIAPALSATTGEYGSVKDIRLVRQLVPADIDGPAAAVYGKVYRIFDIKATFLGASVFQNGLIEGVTSNAPQACGTRRYYISAAGAACAFVVALGLQWKKIEKRPGATATSKDVEAVPEKS